MKRFKTILFWIMIAVIGLLIVAALAGNSRDPWTGIGYIAAFLLFGWIYQDWQRDQKERQYQDAVTRGRIEHIEEQVAEIHRIVMRISR